MKYILFFILYFLGIVPFVMSQSLNKSESSANLSTFCSNQKGFNLLGKFDVSWSNKGFKEKEFQVIKDLGFNFVRLPLDYRTYTLTGNWNYIIENRIKNIDEAIQWGAQYNIHVCINLHRAPGYCVNSSASLPVNHQLDLWTDTVAQNVFVNHWKFFANRYKDISPERLSFNLVNEPSNVSEQEYVHVMKKAIEVIHEISPERIIFVDGLNYANEIILSLKDEPNIAQAIHCYSPFNLTHYKAGWVGGSDEWPIPTWPILWISDFLYGPWKSEFQSALVFQHNFPKGMEIIVNVRQVSIESTLRIKADNKTIYTKNFVCGPNPGVDFTKIIETQWGYQNISNKDFSVTLNEQAASIAFDNSSGDWMTINYISMIEGSDTVTYYISDNTWGEQQETYIIDETKTIKTIDGNDVLPFESYRNSFLLAKENNIPFMVQEFGVHNKTPHNVTVAFLDDLSNLFFENNVGWALWNLNGSFGILNSDRPDCNYEFYNGFNLDREMYESLMKHDITNSKYLKVIDTFKIFPIPAKNELYISNKSMNGKTSVQINDITGRLIKIFEIKATENEIIKLDISELKSSLYLITISNRDRFFTGKFLKD